MTVHRLKITIDRGEMTYGRAEIVCSDNGGPDCAEGVLALDCASVAADRDDYIKTQMAEYGASETEAIEGWNDEGEHCADTCTDGWWWEGDHYHPAPGTGCYYVSWVDGTGHEVLDLAEPIELDLGPVTLRNTATPEEPVFRVKEAAT